MHLFVSFSLLPSELHKSCLSVHQIAPEPSRVTECYLMLFDEGSKGGGKEESQPSPS